MPHSIDIKPLALLILLPIGLAIDRSAKAEDLSASHLALLPDNSAEKGPDLSVERAEVCVFSPYDPTLPGEDIHARLVNPADASHVVENSGEHASAPPIGGLLGERGAETTSGSCRAG